MPPVHREKKSDKGGQKEVTQQIHPVLRKPSLHHSVSDTSLSKRASLEEVSEIMDELYQSVQARKLSQAANPNLMQKIKTKCEKWDVTVIDDLDTMNNNLHGVMALDIFRSMIFNFEKLNLLDCDEVNKETILNRLYSLSYDEFPKNDVFVLMKEFAKYPSLGSFFKALMPKICHGYQELLSVAMNNSNLDAIDALLSSKEDIHKFISQDKWLPLIALSVEQSDEVHLAFEGMVVCLTPENQLVVFDHLYKKKHWRALEALFCIPPFLRALGSSLENYKEEIDTLAQFCIQDSQYKDFFMNLHPFLEKAKYREYAEKAAKHGNEIGQTIVLTGNRARPKEVFLAQRLFRSY